MIPRTAHRSTGYFAFNNKVNVTTATWSIGSFVAGQVGFGPMPATFPTNTFAGTTLRSIVGLEGASAVFARFRQRRRAERDYIRLDPDENSAAPPPGTLSHAHV